MAKNNIVDWKTITNFVNSREAKYCEATNNRYRLHAQVGIDSDGRENSPGARIPVGSEPEMYKQIELATLTHKYFPTGTGDIYRFDEGEKLDKIKGDLKMSAMEINSLEEDIKSARIAGALMRSEEKGRKEGIEKGIKEGKGYLEIRNMKVEEIKKCVINKMKLFGSENKA